MNNKPVAWINKHGDEGWLNWDEIKGEGWTATPLYTHPSKDLTDDYCKAYWGKDNCFVDVFLPNSETEVIRFWNDQLNESYEPKTLTDEEIIKLFDSYEFSDEGVVEFAHELLRKAGEK